MLLQQECEHLASYRSARVSPASGVALGPAGPAADSRGRRRVVQPSALHMCSDPDPANHEGR